MMVLNYKNIYIIYILLYMIALDHDTHMSLGNLCPDHAIAASRALVQQRDSGATYFSSESSSRMMARAES
jgi:hypothetical protein